MPRSPRKRLGEGIFRDATGLSAVVAVRELQREKRFPLGTALEELRAWRKRTRVDLEAIAPRATRGTLAAVRLSLASWAVAVQAAQEGRR